MRLTAVIVNHGSGRFAVPAARSVRQAWARVGMPHDLDLVVVDQPAGVDQTQWLDQLALEGARVVRSPRNDGYAGGLARGLAGTDGAEEDLVMVLNPDLLLEERCLEELIHELLENPTAGVVGPRTWLDEGRTFQLPPPALPGGRTEVHDLLAARWPLAARSVASGRSRLAWEAWLATRPLERPMLSGSCLLMPRAVLRQLGLFLDPAFPLYYEDADLAKRVHALRRTCVYVPTAEAVHFGARSSGTGAEFEEDPRARWRVSRDLFLDRYANPLARRAVRSLEAWWQRGPRERLGRPAHRANDLGALTTPPSIDLPPGGPWLVELSLAPTFGFAAGAVLPGGTQAIPARTFDWLFEGPVHLRVLAPHDLRCFRAYTFQKASPVTASPSLELLEQARTTRGRHWTALQDAARVDAPSSVRDARGRRAA